MTNEILKASSEETAEGLAIGFEEVSWIPGCLVVHLAGYIDYSNHHYLKKRLETAVDEGFTRLILDMSGISFIGSTGAGVVVSLQKSLREKAGEVVLQDVQPKVYEVFDLLGFSRFFTVSHGLETSLAHFTKKPEPPVFPKVFACPLCAAKLRAGRAGRFRCPQCRTILVLADTGAVEPVRLPMAPLAAGA